MSSDNVLHIKGTLKRRKNDIRKSKVMHFLACGIVVAAGAAGIVFAHSQKTVDTYFAKTESLNSGFKELEDKRSELEIAKNDVENQRQELVEEQERILSEAELVAQNNEKLIQDFTNAVYKGEQWVKDHSAEEIAKVIANYFPGTEESLIKTAVQSYKDIDAWNENPVLKQESFDKLQLIMTEAGELTQKAPYEKIVNNSFAEEVINK